MDDKIDNLQDTFISASESENEIENDNKIDDQNEIISQKRVNTLKYQLFMEKLTKTSFLLNLYKIYQR